ncbi:MAG: hypothetical protein U5R31_10220 [Acidimicrobiia bacterium]|nr:hypothetical protein [Acidimicrobiia bacterium]
MPVGQVDGLPVGMQVMARHHREDQLLDLAADRRARAPLAPRRTGRARLASGQQRTAQSPVSSVASQSPAMRWTTRSPSPRVAVVRRVSTRSATSRARTANEMPSPAAGSSVSRVSTHTDTRLSRLSSRPPSPMGCRIHM